MKPNDFWPFGTEPLCDRCLEPIDPSAPRVVATWVDDKPIGVRHESCAA